MSLKRRFCLSPIDTLVFLVVGRCLRRQIPIRLDWHFFAHLRVTVVHSGTGFEVMSRIAAPMVGGMISSTVLTLAVIPAIYALVKQWWLANVMEVWGSFIAIIAIAEFGCEKWR